VTSPAIETSAVPRRDRRALAILAPLCLTAFLGSVSSLAVSPLLPDMADDLGTSVAVAGQIVTATLVAAALCGLIVGPIADHAGARRSITAGLLLTAASALATALSSSYLLVMLARLAGGIGGAVTLGVSLGVAGSSFTGGERQRALGLITAAIAGGASAGIPVVTLLADVGGWRGAFVAIAAALALNALVTYRMLPAGVPAARNSGRSVAAIVESYAPLLSDRRMTTLYAATALFATGWMGAGTYIGAYMVDEHGFSIRQVGLVYMVGGGGVFAGSLLGAGRSGSIGVARLFILSSASMALLWAFLFGGGSLVGALVPTLLLGVIGLLGGMGLVSLTTLIANETPAGPSTTMVLRGSVFNLGSAFGALLGGLLLAQAGYPALAIGLPPSIMLAALWVWWSGRRLTQTPYVQEEGVA
jgi:DHA1 family inner membrane transport protein